MRRTVAYDRVFGVLDSALRTLVPSQCPSNRPNPADTIPQHSPDPKLSATLMRINHTGEVCAQALYAGQALTSRDPKLADQLFEASLEEEDHLAWCQQRLQTLNSRTSYLNPLWYLGSLMMGSVAGLLGDRLNLGFLAETEHQVVSHLNDQLEKLPKEDFASRAIVEQMKIDEAQHENLARKLGAMALPFPVKTAMKVMAVAMKSIVRWV